MITKNMKTFLAMACMAAPLTACSTDMYAPGSLNENRVQVQEQGFSENMMLDDVNDAYIQALARHYTKHGGGGMDLTVTYDPKSYRNTAMKASQSAARLVSALRDQGVSDVKTNILPVQEQGDDAHVLISYESYTARAPDGCTSMPGLDNSVVEYSKDYKLGCGVEMMMAKQVARPRDLMGQENTNTTSEGRSASNIVEVYRYGSQNESLDGESASGK